MNLLACKKITSLICIFIWEKEKIVKKILKLLMLLVCGFVVSNLKSQPVENNEDKECPLCLASVYYKTNTNGDLVDEENQVLHVNEFKKLVNESDRSKLIRLPNQEIVAISHVGNDHKHYFHTDCFQEYMQHNPGRSLRCPLCNIQIQTAITLDRVEIYPTQQNATISQHGNDTIVCTIDNAQGFSEAKQYLQNNPNVVKVHLRLEEGIRQIPEVFFTGITNIQTLVLNCNHLTNLPETIRSLTNLQHLDLSSNQLTSIPETIESLTSLQILNLSWNRLNSFPRTILNLIHLQDLNLSSNRLTRIPESIRNLTNLQKLNLGGNRLRRFPRTILNLVHLQHLGLSCNRLTNLPNEIENLERLQELNLFMNRLTSLPESIGNLENLAKLDLMHNHIIPLPTELINRLRRRGVDVRGEDLQRPAPLLQRIRRFFSFSFRNIFKRKA